MIRPATPDATSDMIDLLVACRMFDRDDSSVLTELFSDFFDSKSSEGHALLLNIEDDILRALAYFQPMPAADRVWDLTMIAVQPDVQGRGFGAHLITAVEETLRSQGARLIIVDTSATEQYDLARKFYAKQGYTEEGRIRDYWADGDDKIVFRKLLRVDPLH
ncbi:GNAT family N-acetyltransferase [Cryobacterium sp. PH31-L1]|uniref:GNAT family N-acetyltransferase n=1 Tax=Cryobacterium sp. PH31-L1 TaxID=3046199 RepID=UPI0024BAD120|nr:GNAT family N-acetyltransferase [Cryobacterium sp. PH31-L1]MDJ0377998.1 GNAT family N-acetyltransferase [Cryobacterium sp. PH31-L1]